MNTSIEMSSHPSSGRALNNGDSERENNVKLLQDQLKQVSKQLRIFTNDSRKLEKKMMVSKKKKKHGSNEVIPEECLPAVEANTSIASTSASSNPTEDKKDKNSSKALKKNTEVKKMKYKSPVKMHANKKSKQSDEFDSKKADNTKEMSYSERRNVYLNTFKFQHHPTRALDNIVERREPSYVDLATFEIDFEALNPCTVKEVKSYINFCLKTNPNRYKSLIKSLEKRLKRKRKKLVMRLQAIDDELRHHSHELLKKYLEIAAISSSSESESISSTSDSSDAE